LLDVLKKYYQDGLLLKQTHPTLDLTIWNYSSKVQYERLWDNITTQCRGLVTNSKGDIIARPFKKFFNYEEHKPEEIPNEQFEVYEKMDGSLGILFNYKGEWIMATRGSFTSPQALMGKYILDIKYNTSQLLENYTYLVEIIYPENRIVCDYGNEEKLVLLAIIRTETGEELSYDLLCNESNITEIPLVTLYKTSGKGYDFLKEEISKDKEGYVIRFKGGFRMKVKGDEYKRLHRILTNISNRDIWEYLKENKPFDEILDKVPDEFYNWVKETKELILNNFKKIEEENKWIFKVIMRANGVNDRKIFASYASKHKHPSILFSMYDNRKYEQIIWKLVYPNYSKPFKKDEN
jgi:RNA ligase